MMTGTSMVFGLFLMVFGIGAFCALIYKMAVYALPVMVGFWAAFAALHSGSGPVLGFAIGFVVGAIVFGIGQSIWNSRQPKALRYAVALIFVVPAMLTGYYTTQQISTLVVPSPSWQFVSAIAGAIAVGMTAFVRLTGVPVLSETMTQDSHI
jgi:hypothetical protein